MSEGWHCPGCQKHHGPHVDTCPGETGGGPMRDPYVTPFAIGPAVIPSCWFPDMTETGWLRIPNTTARTIA